MIERRVGLLFACFLLLFVIAIGRAAWVQGIQGGGLAADAQSQQTQTVTIPGRRGRILDRHGRELAVSEDAADVIATPYQVEDPARAARRLAPLLNVSEAEILRLLADRSSGFAYLARQVGLPVADRVRKLKLAGIAWVPSSRRVYPEGKLAAPVIGTVGVDGEGLAGLEAGDDDLLGGANGERQVVLDGLGNEIERDTLNGAEQGEDLRLTIDAGIQARTEEVLADVAQTYQPKRATAIVMDPRNAEVLAMADWPSFDPSDPASASPEALRSMATGFTYEPGSTFKAFTVAGGLSERLVTPSTVFYLPIEIQVADRSISDAEDRGAESLTVAQILAQSSNVGAVKVGLELGDGALLPLGAAIRLRGSDRDRLPRRGAGHRPHPVGVLGLHDRQPADRPGSLGDPDADGDRLRGDRQRRRPAPAAADPRGGGDARRGAAPATE